MLSTPKGRGTLFLASSLHDGLEDNDMKQVTTLLEHNGADPNVLLPMHGITPFHLIIGNQSEIFAEKVTKLFLRHGGNPNVKSNDGMTPVHVAAAWGRVKILELLLANGGDPLCLDDDERTPFHYAFDGRYYDAITVLGKYSTKNQEMDDDDDDGDDEDDESKIHIKLEKILVNRDDIIAEYIPSEIDLTNEPQYETRNDIVSVEKFERMSLNYFENKHQINSKNTETNSSSTEESVNLNTNNITFRRGQLHNSRKNAISPILPVDNCNFDSSEKNMTEEKIFVDEIINRLSNSYSKCIEKSSNINEITNAMKNNKSNKYCSLLPQPKYFINYLNSRENKTKSALLETSIVSKSPNFHVPFKNKSNTPKSVNTNETSICKKKTFTTKSSEVSPNVRRSTNVVTSGVSSTPKKKLCESTVGVKKIDRTPNRTSLNKTYTENTCDNSLSTDVKTTLKINRQKLYKNIVKNLDDAMYDDDCESNEDLINNCDENLKEDNVNGKTSSVQLKFQKFLNIVDTKTNLDFNKDKSTVQQIINNKQNTAENYINIAAFAESPGSSHPISINSRYQSIKSESDLNEEKNIWNELDEIYKNKGQTPPASISLLSNNSSTNSNNSQTSLFTETDDKIFNTNNFKLNSNEITTCSEQSSNIEIYKTPLRSPISSVTSVDSFMSVDEEYAYIDIKKDIAFMERRLRVLPKVDNMNNTMYESTWLNRYGELSNATSQVTLKSSNEFDKFFNRGEFGISNISLRQYLIALGDAPGPITHTTYNVYLKRLYKLKRENSTKLNQCVITSQSHDEAITKNSRIPKILLSTDWIVNLKFYRNLEDLAFREYEKPNVNKKYRGGMAKTSFNYLLMDPRVTNDLPRNGRDLSLAERWKIFLKAIFYVGKGKCSRPFAHLYESHEIWTGKKNNDESNEKIQRILNIWNDEKGVVCHQVFIYSMQEEAFTREAAMIDALGINNLCNCNRGNYYGLAATMSNEEKKALGKYLLYKAMEILMHDGERQQFPRNIK